MEILWVFIGIVYIVYKLYKERSNDFSWIRFFMKCLIVVPLSIGGIIIYLSELNNFVLGMIIGFIIQIVGLGLVMLWIQSSEDAYDIKKSRSRYSVEEVQNHFIKCGHTDISISKYEDLVNSSYSPLKSLKLNSAGTVLRCYCWMCDQDSWEIDKLSDIDISQRLGVPLSIIPLDQSIPPGNALLKRKTLAKDYILRKDGLLYRNPVRHINRSEEYYSIFNCFINNYISEHR